MKIGYKIFNTYSGELKSMFSDYNHDITYKKGINKRPEGWGPICLFDSFDNAYRYQRRWSNDVIRKVRYEESKDRYVWVRLLEGKFFSKEIMFPEGTVFADVIVVP